MRLKLDSKFTYNRTLKFGMNYKSSVLEKFIISYLYVLGYLPFPAFLVYQELQKSQGYPVFPEVLEVRLDLLCRHDRLGLRIFKIRRNLNLSLS